MTHTELTKKAAYWCKNSLNCRIVLRELTTCTTTGEIPDVIGFKSDTSVLIECKMSRADFFADKKKIFRRKQSMGVGNYRIILCPAGLIQPEEVYENWGVAWVKGNRVYPQNFKTRLFSYNLKRFAISTSSERALLVSVCNRLVDYKHFIIGTNGIETK